MSTLTSKLYSIYDENKSKKDDIKHNIIMKDNKEYTMSRLSRLIQFIYLTNEFGISSATSKGEYTTEFFQWFGNDIKTTAFSDIFSSFKTGYTKLKEAFDGLNEDNCWIVTAYDFYIGCFFYWVMATKFQGYLKAKFPDKLDDVFNYINLYRSVDEVTLQAWHNEFDNLVNTYITPSQYVKSFQLKPKFSESGEESLIGMAIKLDDKVIGNIESNTEISVNGVVTSISDYIAKNNPDNYNDFIIANHWFGYIYEEVEEDD